MTHCPPLPLLPPAVVDGGPPVQGAWEWASVAVPWTVGPGARW